MFANYEAAQGGGRTPSRWCTGRSVVHRPCSDVRDSNSEDSEREASHRRTGREVDEGKASASETMEEAADVHMLQPGDSEAPAPLPSGSMEVDVRSRPFAHLDARCIHRLCRNANWCLAEADAGVHILIHKHAHTNCWSGMLMLYTCMQVPGLVTNLRRAVLLLQHRDPGAVSTGSWPTRRQRPQPNVLRCSHPF